MSPVRVHKCTCAHSGTAKSKLLQDEVLPPPWQLCCVVMAALLAGEGMLLLSSSISSAVTTSEKEQGQDYRAARSISLWKGLWRDEVIAEFFF